MDHVRSSCLLVKGTRSSTPDKSGGCRRAALVLKRKWSERGIAFATTFDQLVGLHECQEAFFLSKH